MAKIEKICLVVASETTAKAFLREQIAALSKRYDVTLILNSDTPDFAARIGLAVKVMPVAIARKVSPASDLLALFRLVALFRKTRFDLVHSITPKAGMLAMLAGKLAGVSFRIHTFTGQVWATRRGLARRLLKTADRVIVLSATHVLADSFSQRQFLIDQRVAPPEKLMVLVNGSISGVDMARFRPDEAARNDIRQRLGLDGSDVLVLFLGRLNRDKGVLDLATAFADVAMQDSRLRLLFVGPDEGELEETIRQICAGAEERIRFVNYTDAPETYLAAADMLCLPSYREGFGSVIIEAAACGVPTVASRIYGITDAVVEGETGLLFPPGDVRALGTALSNLAAHAGKRVGLGEKAFARAHKEFSSDRLVEAWLAFYDSLSKEGS